MSPGEDDLMTDADPGVIARMNEYRSRLQAHREQRPEIVKTGREALARLATITEGDSGQCRIVASFLLGLYNGTRFPFDLTDFRGLDFDLFEDCVAVLRMDSSPDREVHHYVEGGGDRFEALAETFGIADRRKG